MTLAPGTRVLHIGPHKTGTTTLQAALHENRDALAEEGVLYAGARRHSMAAAMAIASSKRLPTAGGDDGMRAWEELRAEVVRSPARLSVLSSEFYSDAPRDRISTILDELGREDTHVVVTLRPLVRILPSQWQQYMQNGPPIGYDPALGYEQWLERILEEPEIGTVSPSFWRRHRHDRLIRAWADEVGVDRLTVVVVDERDKTMLMRSFEELLGVTPGVLTPPGKSANRSLTVPELQLLRAFNAAYASAGYSSSDYTYLVRFGAARFLQERSPDPDEARLLTPRWAVSRAAEIGAAMAGSIADSGVRIIGDLGVLSDESVASGVGDNPRDVPVPAHVTARFTAGLIERLDRLPADEVPESRSAGDIENSTRRNKMLRKWRAGSRARRRLRALRSELEGARRIEDLSRPELLRVLLGRARGRVARRLGQHRSTAR